MSGPQERVYYDHEPAYRKIEARGGRGWDDLRPQPPPDSYEALRTFLASPLAPAPGKSVNALALGCGGGQAAIMLAERGYRVFGVDYSPTAVRLAARNACEAGLTLHLLVGDCLRRFFRVASMDLVVDNHVFHCIIGTRDRRAFLSAARDILKPGGVLFSETMSCDGDFDAAAVEADPVTRIACSRTRYWVSRQELCEEYGSAGFRILYQAYRSPEDSGGTGANLVTYAVRP